MEHMVHCGPTKLLRHNMLQAKLVKFAHEHCVATQQNPRLTVEKAKGMLEPDIVFYSGIAKPLETDVTVINACSHKRVESSKSKFAMKEARARKVQKYRKRAMENGHDFAPLVFETHGAMGEEVDQLLRRVAANTEGGRGLAVQDMKLELAVSLVRGNARCARQVVARSLRQRDIQRRQADAVG
jgi:hypothetical protein